MRRLAWLPLIACALGGPQVSSSALAQAARIEQPRPAAPPLPPRKPPELGGAPPLERARPAPQQELQQERSGQELSGQEPALRDEADAPTGLTPHAQHPAFERQPMRACGEEWQAMKRAGRTSDKVWRDFAAECIPRQSKQR